jgi:hypothetical protein
MLEKLFPQWMRSDKYEVKSKDMYSFTYVEGEKQLIISREILGDPFRMLIYISKIAEWTEPKGEKIDEAKIEEIKKNCKEGWNFLDTPVVFK